MQVSAKELRGQTKRLLDAVERGEEVILSYRGKPRARIVPMEEERVAEGEEPLFGLWRDRADMEDVAEYVRELRKGRSF